MNQMDQNKRLLLAVLLSGGLLLVWQAFVIPPPEPTDIAVEQAEGEPEEPAAAVAEAEPESIAEPEGTEATAEVLDLHRMHTGNLDLAFTNVGARLAWAMIEEPEQYIPRDDMRGIFPQQTERVGVQEVNTLPFAFVFPEGAGPNDQSVYTLDEQRSRRTGETFDELVYSWTGPGGMVVERTIAPADNEFGLRMGLRVINGGSEPLVIDGLSARLYARYGDQTGSIFNPGASIVEALCRVSGRMERRHGIKVEEQREYSGPVDFIGVNERYFLSALIPAELPAGVSVSGCRFDPAGQAVVASELNFDRFVVPPGGEGLSFEFFAYVGPKHASYLGVWERELEQTIDLGWMSFLAKPLRWLLLFLQGFVINWGLAIILLTVVIKLLLTPLTHKSFMSMEKMREVGPQLQELRKKYENDPTKMAEQQMKLFREAGVNPLGGCLPMLLQMPIYIALYQTIWGSAELYNASFVLWITDLSQRDPYYLLPVLMGAVMFVQQRMMPTAVDNPQMKVMQTVMPFLFTIFMLFLPSGLVLYIFVNMILSVAHQLYLRKRLAAAKVAAGK